MKIKKKEELSKIKYKELNVNIDFDLSKKEWRKNKKEIGNGMFKYKCQYKHKNGKICNQEIYLGINKKNNYNFGGISRDMNNLLDNPIKKKACKRHWNRYIKSTI